MDSSTPDIAFTSHKWPSTSAWSARELSLLHVDNLAVEDILKPDSVAPATDKRLETVLAAIPYGLDVYNDYKKIDARFERKHDVSHGYPVSFFYEAIAAVVRSDNSQVEESSPLNLVAEQIAGYIEEVGSALPQPSSRRDLEESNPRQSGSPPEIYKTVSFAQDPEQQRDGAQTQDSSNQSMTSFPKSIRKSTSDDSNLSIEMGVRENDSEEALFELLKLILYLADSRELSCHRPRGKLHVMFGPSSGLVSINDGSIVADASVRKRTNSAFINIDCKSRRASTRIKQKLKIAAQEVGESIAIVQERMRLSRNVISRFASSQTVYTIAMHGRQAYFSRVDFSAEYIDALEAQNLRHERLVRYNSKRSYRLDEEGDLHEFVKVFVRLMCQIESEIKAGRRV